MNISYKEKKRSFFYLGWGGDRSMIKMQKVLDKFKQNANIGAVLHPQHAHNAPPHIHTT